MRLPWELKRKLITRFIHGVKRAYCATTEIYPCRERRDRPIEKMTGKRREGGGRGVERESFLIGRQDQRIRGQVQPAWMMDRTKEAAGERRRDAADYVNDCRTGFSRFHGPSRTGSPRRTCASKGGGNRRVRARWTRHWNWSLDAGGIALRVLFMSDQTMLRTINSASPRVGPPVDPK